MCVCFFFNICPKRAVLKKIFKNSSLTILLSSLVFIFGTLKKITLKFYYNNISLPWAPAFFLLEHLFCLSHRKTRWTMSLDNVGLKICLLGYSDSMVTLTFFLGVNRSGPRMSSTTNHKIYRALGQLQGPWCKQILLR